MPVSWPFVISRFHCIEVSVYFVFCKRNGLEREEHRLLASLLVPTITVTHPANHRSDA